MVDDTCPEVWQPVLGYEGLYEVSSQGRVRSLNRTIELSDGGSRRLRGCLLAAKVAKGAPYPFVGLHKDGQQAVRTVHRLVADAFLGPRPAGQEVLHGPGGYEDPRLVNLSYGTRSENMHDRRRDGTDPQVNKTHCPRGHALAAPNLVRFRAQRGARCCLACSRGQSKVRNYRVRHRIELDLQTESDRHFAQIMGLSA